MVRVLGTDETSACINRMVETADDHIIIVSPFLNINQRLRRKIEAASTRGVVIVVLYGKKERMDEDTRSWLMHLDGASLWFLRNLHAKAYMNENVAIITSMNLLELSQVNNEELGVAFDREDDEEQYDEVRSRARSMFEIAEWRYGMKDISFLFSEVLGSGDQDGPFEAQSDNSDGMRHCIKCGTDLHPSRKVVYCDSCMRTWARYAYTNYSEKNGHCFICGKSCEVSASHPACLDCFLKNTDYIYSICDHMDRMSVNDSMLRPYR